MPAPRRQQTQGGAHTGPLAPTTPLNCLMRRKELDRGRRLPDDALAISKLDLLAPMELLRWALPRNPVFLPRLFRICKGHLGYLSCPIQPTHPCFSRHSPTSLPLHFTAITVDVFPKSTMGACSSPDSSL